MDYRARESRHSGLNAWGTAFAGIAALMTVFTAAATSYVALATYQEQRQQEAEQKKNADVDFAQRVEFVTALDGSVTLDNPNPFALSYVIFRVTAREQAEGTTLLTNINSDPMLLPACSYVRADFASAMAHAQELEIPSDLAKQKQSGRPSAYFEDRNSKGWVSSGDTAFVSRSYDEFNRRERGDPATVDLQTWVWKPDLTIRPSAAWVKFTKSPRCK
ncbi:hypothetical protein ACIRP7_27950 [Streptomyces sp. NPDC102270]|uniref:hypothetical protein n=1 Tax=Streptomyces sp. NPDC102270 TaxID=3366150 RepID=UPI003825F4BC